MKISIITAIYNSIQHLSNVLDNIRNPTYPNIECVIIDAGSIKVTIE